MNYENYEDPFIDEIPKYRKRKGKDTPKKSNHKHQYEDYIGVVDKSYGESYFPVTECIICGRVDKIGLFFTGRTERGYFTSMDDLQKIKDIHPELKIKKYTKFPW